MEFLFRDFDFETQKMRYFDIDKYDRNEHDCYGNMMMFTSFHAAGSKKIYVGDILSANLKGDIHCGLGGIVEFFEGCFCLKIKSLVSFKKDTANLYDVEQYVPLSELQDIDIEGNIHENPEVFQSVIA